MSEPLAVEDARARVQAVEEALESLEQMPPRERERAFAALKTVLDLYGACLQRVLFRLEQRDSSVTPAVLAEDELIGHLLMLHELHPFGFRQPEDIPPVVQLGERPNGRTHQ